MKRVSAWPAAAVVAVACVLVVHQARAQSAPPPTAAFTVDPAAPKDSSTPAVVPAPAPSAAVAPSPPVVPGEPSREPAAAVAEQPKPRFGDQGQVVITGAMQASLRFLGSTDLSGVDVNVVVQPALDYFVARRVSLGGFLLVAYEDSKPFSSGNSESTDTKTTSVGIGAEVGYDVRLGESVSLWPLLEFGSSLSHRKTFLGGESNQLAFGVGVYLPLLFHPAPHFFLGIGPYAFLDVVSPEDAESSQFIHLALSSTVGGWF